MEEEIQYWAGGVKSGDQQRILIEEFLKESKWKRTIEPNEPTQYAKQISTVMERMKIGDKFALKINHHNKIRIKAIGIIREINEDKTELKIEWDDTKEFLVDRPKSGEGTGNWAAIITQLKDNSVINQVFNISNISSSYLECLEINNFKRIDNLLITDLKDKREIYFLGENGDGKTSVLQAILLALKYNNLDNYYSYQIEKMGALSSLRNSNHEFKFTAQVISDDNIIEIKKETNGNRAERKQVQNVYAYGVTRAKNNFENRDESGFLTLFDSNAELNSPIGWIKERDRIEKNNINISPRIEKVFELLVKLLSNHPDSIDLKIYKNLDAEIVFDQGGIEVSFEQLSEGYRSVIIMLCDLLSRLADNYPDAQEFIEYKAIVLIDEIDLHLHPKWAYTIVQKLLTWFPSIQFFFTTHSPIVVLGASKEAVFYKVYKEEGNVKISEPYYAKDFSNAMANVIITSPLFDLDSARMFSFNENSNLDTSDSYLSSKISKHVAKEINELKLKGQNLFTDVEVDALIEQAFTEQEEG
jgi:predicted ATP-binding protein involved in virulence